MAPIVLPVVASKGFTMPLSPYLDSMQKQAAGPILGSAVKGIRSAGRLGIGLLSGRGRAKARNMAKRFVSGAANKVLNPVGDAMVRAGQKRTGGFGKVLDNVGQYVGGTGKFTPLRGAKRVLAEGAKIPRIVPNTSYLGGGLGNTLGNMAGTATSLSVYGVPMVATERILNKAIGTATGAAGKTTPGVIMDGSPSEIASRAAGYAWNNHPRQ